MVDHDAKFPRASESLGSSSDPARDQPDEAQEQGSSSAQDREKQQGEGEGSKGEEDEPMFWNSDDEADAPETAEMESSGMVFNLNPDECL